MQILLQTVSQLKTGYFGPRRRVKKRNAKIIGKNPCNKQQSLQKTIIRYGRGN